MPAQWLQTDQFFGHAGIKSVVYHQVFSLCDFYDPMWPKTGFFIPRLKSANWLKAANSG